MQAIESAAAKPISAKQVANDLLRIWGCVQRGHEGTVFELFEELNLTITQMKTLQTLDHCAEELSLKALSEKLGLSLPATSRMIDGMHKRGWVQRREDEHDRRMKRVRISADGRVVAQQILNARLAGLEDFAASMTPSQRAQLHAVLSTID